MYIYFRILCLTIIRMTKERKKGGVASLLTPVSSLATSNPLPMPVSAVPLPGLPNPGSPPPSAPLGAPNTPFPTVGGMDPMSNTLMYLNSNPFIIGAFMLLLNLGGRFLALELTKKQEEFLQAPWVRPAIFFTVVFIATRNLAAAFWVSLIFFFIIWVAANEKSPYCMIPSWCGHDTASGKKNYEFNVKTLFQEGASPF